MSGELPSLEHRPISAIFFHLIGLAATLIAVELGFLSDTIIVDTNVQIQFYVLFAILGSVIFALWFFPWKKLKVLFSAFLILFYALLVIFSIPYFNLTILFAIPLMLELREFRRLFRLKSREGTWLVSVVVALMAMILLSGLLRALPSAQGIGMLVASISDDVTPGGTPLLFVGGLVFFTQYLVFSISVQALLMFVVLSFLLVENYFLIISFIRGNSRSIIGGQVSGALTVLSCQCESITAAFPAIVSLVLTAAIVPLILESIILVFMTNYLLRRRYLIGKRSSLLDSIYPIKRQNLFLAGASVTIISLPLIETFGVYYGLQSSLYFFGSLDFLMLMAGIFVALLIERSGLLHFHSRGRLKIMLALAVSAVSMFIWFYPPLALYTVSNGPIFALMSVVSFGGGVLAGLVYVIVGIEGRKLFLEFLAMMFTMFAIVVFYISILTGYSIWPFFGLTEQVIFSIAIWLVSLPFMWFATNIALNHSVRAGVQA